MKPSDFIDLVNYHLKRNYIAYLSHRKTALRKEAALKEAKAVAKKSASM